VPSRSWKAALAAALVFTALGTSSCTTSSYAGIALTGAAADPELQALARRARDGDRHAQLELGIRYEEGRGVPADLARAEQLYRRAAAGADDSRMVYVPGGNGRAGSWTILSGGARSGGLEQASLRLLALNPTSTDRRVEAEVAEGDDSTPDVCPRLQRALTVLYGAPPTECQAYPFEVRPGRGRSFTVYDLVVTIPPEAAAARDYPADLVDPVALDLIDRPEPVRGRLTYYLVPAGDGQLPIIRSFEAER
jgi:hypothetical protein